MQLFFLHAPILSTSRICSGRRVEVIGMRSGNNESVAGPASVLWAVFGSVGSEPATFATRSLDWSGASCSATFVEAGLPLTAFEGSGSAARSAGNGVLGSPETAAAGWAVGGTASSGTPVVDGAVRSGLTEMVGRVTAEAGTPMALAATLGVSRLLAGDATGLGSVKGIPDCDPMVVSACSDGVLGVDGELLTVSLGISGVAWVASGCSAGTATGFLPGTSASSPGSGGNPSVGFAVLAGCFAESVSTWGGAEAGAVGLTVGACPRSAGNGGKSSAVLVSVGSGLGVDAGGVDADSAGRPVGGVSGEDCAKIAGKGGRSFWGSGGSTGSAGGAVPVAPVTGTTAVACAAAESETFGATTG